MLGNGVLTGSKRRAGLIVLAAIGVAAILLTLAFIASRLHGTYALEAKLSRLEAAHHDLALTCGTSRGEVNRRLDAIERVLFGDVVPKVDQVPAPPSLRLETSILNNQREFRARIEALERWRLRTME